MNVQERLNMIRLLEKMERNKKYCKSIGIKDISKSNFTNCNKNTKLITDISKKTINKN